MRLTTGLAILVVGYALSQFYRAFLAVLTPYLDRDIGAQAGDLAISSGLWFLAFAVLQLPVGWALDRIGPRRTAGFLFAVAGAGGATVFALASAPWHIHLAMMMLGAGCAPLLMGAYFIIAKTYPASAFGTMAGIMVGMGGLGNILGAEPLVRSVEAFGWRHTMWGLAALTLVVALSALIWVRDPPRETGSAARGSLAELLSIRALWWLLPVIAVNYACAAVMRGLWAGPYLREAFAADPLLVGRVTLLMAFALIGGSFAFGPISRIIGLRKAGLLGTAGLALTLAAMVALPSQNLPLAVVLLGLMGLWGANYAILMAHGRAFMPAHLVGRGITFLNMVSMAGVGALQFGSQPVYQHLSATHAPGQTYAMLFLFFLIPLALAALIYLFSAEAPDEARP